MSRFAAVALACALASCAGAPPPAGRDCGVYTPPTADVDAAVRHLETTATVMEVTSPCTVRVRVLGGWGTIATFTGRVLVLRATERTTFASAPQGDLTAIGRFGLRPGEQLTLSFDGRPFPDGSYPLNSMNW